MNNYYQKLDQLYSSLGVLGVPLETNCKYCKSCWNGIEERMWKNETGNIYKPWIGSFYDQLKVLVIGINMNGHGGYDSMIDLAKYSKKAILDGKRKINFDNDPADYAGTFYWHRVPAYIVALLESQKITTPKWVGNFPSKEDTAKAFDYFAITNSVKCSPQPLYNIHKDKSKPTPTMWENCGNFLLKEEIRILKPEKILICGISDNLYYFNNNILDSPCDFEDPERVIKRDGKIDDREVTIFVVPHPTSFGGNSNKIMVSLKNLLKD